MDQRCINHICLSPVSLPFLALEPLSIFDSQRTRRPNAGSDRRDSVCSEFGNHDALSSMIQPFLRFGNHPPAELPHGSEPFEFQLFGWSMTAKSYHTSASLGFTNSIVGEPFQIAVTQLTHSILDSIGSGLKMPHCIHRQNKSERLHAHSYPVPMSQQYAVTYTMLYFYIFYEPYIIDKTRCLLQNSSWKKHESVSFKEHNPPQQLLAGRDITWKSWLFGFVGHLQRRGTSDAPQNLGFHTDEPQTLRATPHRILSVARLLPPGLSKFLLSWDDMGLSYQSPSHQK